MKLSARKFRWAVAAAAMVLLHGDAAACGMCVWAQFDYYFPWIQEWWWIACAWLLAQAVITGIGGFPAAGHPGIFKAIVLVLVCNAAAFSFFGALPMPLMLLPPLLALIAAIKTQHRKMSNRGSTATLTLGIFMIAALAVTLLVENIRAAGMTRADYAIKHSGTGLERELVNEMRREGVSSEAELEQILTTAEGLATADAARALVSVSPPERAMPILLKSYRRLRENAKLDDYDADSVESAMRDASGLELPADSSPEAWERAWEEQGAQTR